MSQLNDTNYINKSPVAADYAPWVQDSDGVVYTATMTQLAALFASLNGDDVTPTVTALATVITTQQWLVVTAAGATNQELPVNSLNSGRRIMIANKGAGTVTVLPNGTDTIEGAASITLAQYETADLRADGLGMWFRFST